MIITHGKINAPVSKHIEMRTRLKWTVSYKLLYFVHLNLELVSLFIGMRERSINKKILNPTSYCFQIPNPSL